MIFEPDESAAKVRQSARREMPSHRQSGESGNPLVFNGRKMDPRLRGDDVSFVNAIS
jgi:hypothetical protein